MTGEQEYTVYQLAVDMTEGMTAEALRELLSKFGYSGCHHEWVNVSFVGLNYVCRHCDVTQR